MGLRALIPRKWADESEAGSDPRGPLGQYRFSTRTPDGCELYHPARREKLQMTRFPSSRAITGVLPGSLQPNGTKKPPCLTTGGVACF